MASGDNGSSAETADGDNVPGAILSGEGLEASLILNLGLEEPFSVAAGGDQGCGNRALRLSSCGDQGRSDTDGICSEGGNPSLAGSAGDSTDDGVLVPGDGGEGNLGVLAPDTGNEDG